MVKSAAPPRRPGPANRGHKKGLGALKAGNALRGSNASSKPGRSGPKGEKNVKTGKGSHLRSEGTINRLQMYKSKPNIQKMREQPNRPARIQPDRRWFGNTRVIAQNKMQAFRETLSKSVEDPYSVVLRSSKLPMSLLKETEEKSSRMNLLQVEPFDEVFGKKRKQKRAKLGSYDLEGLMQSVSQKTLGYSGDKDTKSEVDPTTGLDRVVSAGDEPGVHAGEEIFHKGTSRRIWGELYKVVDASDVLVFILDARDPMGTRCMELEREIRKNRPGKHIVLLLNKVDLVPTWAARRWVQVLTKEFPTLAFHASITNPFGKNALLNLLRQFGALIKERKHVTIGFVGYPNVGKSSVINTMKHKKVCKSAPVPGETRVWQYISLTKRIYLLDCPGIVPPTASDFSSDCAKVLKGVVRAERIQCPSDYIDEVVTRVKRQYLLQRYKLPPDTTWADGEEFLSILGKKMGKLLKGGDPDLDITARIVLYDWQRGRIPFFTPPPEEDEAPQAAPIQTASAHSPSTSKDAAASSSATADGNSDNVDGEDGATSSAAGTEEATGATEAKSSASSTSTSTTAVVQVHQSLAELSCSMVYDEEDRRGEALPEDSQTGDSKAPSQKRKRASDGDAEAGDADTASAAADAPEPPKKKKKNRRGGKTKAAAKDKEVGASGSREGQPLVPGSVDWKAVVSEFGM